MKVQHITEFKNGWFVGNFDPSIFKTDQFEVGIMLHKKGDVWPCHYHTGREINCLLSGIIKIHNTVLSDGDVFMLEPFEIADPEFVTDCTIVVVKTPSMPGDKYEANRPVYKESL
mgnify:CR=1 FL=1